MNLLRTSLPAVSLLLLSASFAIAARADEAAEAPATPPSSFRTGLLTEQNIDRSREDFNQCLEAAAQVRVTEKAYATGKREITDLLQAERKLTAAQIHYMTTTNNVRGNPAMRDYLTRRGEVSALERGLASTTQLIHTVADGDIPEVRRESKRYQEALKEARRELLRAEYAWKATARADQLRYLNRKQDPR